MRAKHPGCAGVVLAVMLLAGGPTAAAKVQGAATAPTRVEVVQTSPALAQYLTRLPDATLSFRRWTPGPEVMIDTGVRFQRIIGFGAAVTDSSAWLIHERLDGAGRAALMQELFGPDGIALGFIRVPMGASDFSATGTPYSYDDLAPGRSDPSLAHFSIAHDARYILPVLQELRRINPHAYLLANPWSPPGWMKANDKLDNLNWAGWLTPAAYEPLAGYFVRFLKAYSRAGVRVDAVTPENEPGVPSPYPGMTFPPYAEGNFVGRDLAPALTRARLTTRIFGFDASWAQDYYPDDLLRSRGRSALAGIAWHCYFGSPDAMTRFHALAPALAQVVDECSPELRPFSTAELLLGSLRNWAKAVTVWNLALAPDGGPVQPPNPNCNGCTGVVTIDPATGSVSLGLKYFQLGQVSRFVHPGAVRVRSDSFVGDGVNGANMYQPSAGVQDVAFLNPGGEKVLVAYNSASRALRFTLRWQQLSLTYRIPPGAMTTFRWR